MKLVLFTIFVAWSFPIYLEASCPSCKAAPQTVCGPYNALPIADIIPYITSTDPTGSYYFVDKLWNMTRPRLSHCGRDLEAAIRTMALSNVTTWKVSALAATGWIWTALPSIRKKPSLCGFAKIIDTFVQDGGNAANCTNLLAAMGVIGQSITDHVNFAVATSKRHAGCPIEKYPRTTVPSCYKNGYEYPRKQLWRLIKGSNYPIEYKRAAKCLAKSHRYQDRFMGAVANAVTTPHLVNAQIGFNQTFFAQLLTMETIDPIPNYCCSELYADLDETYAFLGQTLLDTATYTLKAAGCA